jgi:hypothetical protein
MGCVEVDLWMHGGAEADVSRFQHRGETPALLVKQSVLFSSKHTDPNQGPQKSQKPATAVGCPTVRNEVLSLLFRPFVDPKRGPPVLTSFGFFWYRAWDL